MKEIITADSTLKILMNAADLMVGYKIKLDLFELKLQNRRNAHEAKKKDYNNLVKQMIAKGRLSPADVAALESYIEKKYNECWAAQAKPVELLKLENKNEQ